MAKLIARVTHQDLTGAPIEFNVIEVDEEVVMFDAPLTNTHRYWVPATVEIDDEEEYLEPVDDPDYNFRMDFALYRDKYHFLLPDEIKLVRKRLGLTIREVGVVLAIDPQQLSEIEDNVALQSFDQEVKLCWLTKRSLFAEIVDGHRELIRERCVRYGVNADDLFKRVLHA
ncbi:hypothetical protein [Levilactobacillus fujinensis]|uniref:HTH cro/C1-type domain-containing protein n=1 Tax=Levilactobacillus fujinensis TaxID=2486024 RepID=A0ABW1TIP5_9LACO|nr:hypothetical protein [Levilactobacillus fujinensis]